MSDDEILDRLLPREGGFRAQVTRPDGSIDPDTNHGVTAEVLGEWLGLGRWATTEEVKSLKPEMARTIFRKKYITGPGFTAENLPFAPLREQLIDFGINSGPARAIRWLQRVLGCATTGVLDRTTVAILWEYHEVPSSHGPAFFALHLVNDALVAARCHMIRRAVAAGHIRKADENGLLNRALSFILVKI